MRHKVGALIFLVLFLTLLAYFSAQRLGEMASIVLISALVGAFVSMPIALIVGVILASAMSRRTPVVPTVDEARARPPVIDGGMGFEPRRVLGLGMESSRRWPARTRTARARTTFGASTDGGEFYIPGEM